MIAIVIDLVLSHSSGRGARIAQEFQSGDLLQKSTWPAVVATSSVRRLKKRLKVTPFQRLQYLCEVRCQSSCLAEPTGHGPTALYGSVWSQ